MINNSLNLEKLSDENLVKFYKEELQMINLGEPVTTVFNYSVRRTLIKKGILKWSRGHGTTITDMTRALISQA